MGMVVGGRAGGGEKEWESRGNGGIEISGRNSSAYFSGGYTPPIYAVSGEERRGETDRAKGVLARATRTRKALPAAENKLGGFKNFAVPPDPPSYSFSFFIFFLFFFLFLSPFLSNEPSLSLGFATSFSLSLSFLFPSSLCFFSRQYVCRYLVCFVIIPFWQLVARPYPLSDLQTRHAAIFYSNSR